MDDRNGHGGERVDDQFTLAERDVPTLPSWWIYQEESGRSHRTLRLFLRARFRT